MKRQAILFYFILLLCFKGVVGAAEQDLLKLSDVHKIMEQILTYHNNKKDMSQGILKHGLEIYVDQFDSYRIYLIQSEVEPLLNPGAEALNWELESYNSNNFSMFTQLNQRIQAAIQRARLWRSQIEKDPAAVFKDYAENFEKESPSKYFYVPKEYARDTSELEQRMKSYLMRFINEHRRHYGEKTNKEPPEKILAEYESFMRSFENQYLYLDEQGKSLPPQEQENLFTLHILKALASSLDAHTSFYNANEAYSMKVRLKKGFQGIGIVLNSTKEGATIASFVPGGAAAKSGQVKVNDVITAVNGEPVINYTLEQVLELLHNDKEPTVTLTLKRPNETQPIKVTLTRQPIALNEDRATFSSEAFGDGIIGKITLHSFYQSDDGVSAANDVANAITELKKKGHLRGLILDLRDNSGGFLSQAVQVAGLFITNGVVVISKYSDGEEKFYRDIENKIAYNGPLVILTSRITASAAEIVAQALQDYGVALIVGDEQTFGKGTIQTQTITDNQSSSYFKVTVGKYYTVSGKTPQLHGVKADLLVPSRLNAVEIGEEYLEDTLQSEKSDTIAPAYNDPLSDIQPLAKSWYMKYYTPTLQQKVARWRNMIPTLKKNSEYRIAHNKNYQLFLKDGKDQDNEEDEEWPFTAKKLKDFGENDVQMEEAVNIVEDMVQIEASQPH